MFIKSMLSVSKEDLRLTARIMMPMKDELDPYHP